MATDMSPKGGRIIGNNISLMLDCESDLEIITLYQKLSAGGQQNHQLETTFWGATIDDLTDKYGNHWLLNYTNEITGSKKQIQ